MTDKTKLIWLITAFVLSIAGYNLWLTKWDWGHSFYHLLALFLLILVWLLREEYRDKKWLFIWADIWVWCAFGNLIDEITRKATEVNLMEYVFGGILITHHVLKGFEIDCFKWLRRLIVIHKKGK